MELTGFFKVLTFIVLLHLVKGKISNESECETCGDCKLENEEADNKSETEIRAKPTNFLSTVLFKKN